MLQKISNYKNLSVGDKVICIKSLPLNRFTERLNSRPVKKMVFEISGLFLDTAEGKCKLLLKNIYDLIDYNTKIIFSEDLFIAYYNHPNKHKFDLFHFNAN